MKMQSTNVTFPPQSLQWWGLAVEQALALRQGGLICNYHIIARNSRWFLGFHNRWQIKCFNCFQIFLEGWEDYFLIKFLAWERLNLRKLFHFMYFEDKFSVCVSPHSLKFKRQFSLFSVLKIRCALLSEMAMVSFCATQCQNLSEKCALYRIIRAIFFFFFMLPYKHWTESLPAFLAPPEMGSWELQNGAAYCVSFTCAKRSRVMESAVQKV